MKKLLSEQGIEKQDSPLSFSQEGLWILDNLDNDSNAYNNSYSLKMVGSIDISYLTKSINKIQERHEVLRSRFSHHDKGMPTVFIDDFKEIELPVIDISQFENKDNILEELLKEETKSILKLNEGRLARYKYIKYSEEISYLVLTVHHIIWDEWSIKIFSSELSNFYGRLCQGKDLDIPSLPNQYHDFVKREREYAQKDEYLEKLACWTNSLQDTPKTFKFIGDKNLSKGNVSVEDNKDIVKEFLIPAEISRNLKLISKKNKSTLFMTLFSLFSAVLKRYTSQNKFVIGVPIANRSSYEFENLIGFFTNTLPINVDFLGSDTFREFLKNNRAGLLKAYANQEVSVEKIVETLQVEREKTKAPLVQVSFVYHSLSEKQDSSNDLVTDITEIDSGISKFDLTMAISELEHDLVGEIRCKSTILSMGIVNKMIDDVLRIAALISIDDDILIDNLVFDNGEYDKVIYHFNETDSPYETNKCIHEFIEEQAELIPNQIALVESDKQITYFELNEKANKLANYLLRKGINKRSLVAITTSASIESLISILAVLKTGGAYVPLDIHSPSTRLEYILADCKAPFLLVNKENENEFSFFNGQRILIDFGNEEIAKENVQNPQIEVFQNDLAYVIYTSGSTGKPKGVMVDHRAIVILGKGLNEEIIKQHIHVERPIRFTLNASLAFDASIQQIQSLCYGNEIYLISEKIKYDPEKFVNYIKEHEIDILDCTPSQLNMLIKAGILNANKTKYPLITLIGGETIDQNMWSLLKTCKEKHFYNVYGLTECGVDSTFEYINESLIESNIGSPLPNKKIYILDKNMKPVRIGVPGDIYIGGGGLAHGYLNRPELTAKTFIPDPFAHIPGSRMYKTGDLGLYTEEGKIKFLGRSDNQVQLKGYRVELSEIEATINEIPNVKKSFVCIRQDKEPILVGYVEVTPEKNISIQEIRSFMESRIPYYMIPVQFFHVKKWPLTSNGKLDRTKLMSLNDKFILEEDDVDITPIQQILINLWKGVLKIDDIGIRDNFFELGGHSLLGTQIISKINKTFNLNLSLHSFFRNPTILGVSEEIARSRNKNQNFKYSLIKRVENKPDKLPLSSAQQRLWFMNTLVPNKYIFNIPIFYELKGEVNILSLEKAIQFVINRHEVLRTNFYAVKGELLQVLRDSAPFKLIVNKIDKYTSIENELESFMDKEAKHAFSLTNDLLIRGSIIQINDSRCVLALTFHHIIFDGWSLNIFMKELSCFYNSLVSGENIELNELPIQYSDYTIWQNKELSKEVWVKQLSYWKRKLGGTLPVMQLPVDNSRLKVPSYKGSEEQLKLSKDILEKLKSFCVAQGTTLHMTLLSIFNVMLYKYTNQKDIMVGNFVAGRNKEEIESLIGFFINTLVIRTDLSNNPSFIQLLEQVRENTLDAYENQDIPFDMVVQEVKPDRTIDASPLVRVMFIVQNIPKEDLRFNGFEITQRRRPDDIVKYDLTVKYSEDGGKVVFEYSTDLFSRQTIIGMTNCFQILLETFLENPDKRVDDLTPIQNSKYLNDDKVTKAISDNSRTINEVFKELVKEHPLKTALVYKDSYLTYEELNNKSNQLARYLMKQGVTSNVPVAICVNRGGEYLIGILGVLKAGGAYVPLDPGYPRERLDFIIEDSQAQLVLTTSDIAPTFTQGNVLLCMLDQQFDFTIHSSTNLEWKPKLDDLAYIIYTSGSTGQPKGVMVTHRNLLNLISWQQLEYQISHEDRGTLIAGLGFDAAVWEIFPCLCSGATLYILEEEIRSNPVELQQWMTTNGITIGFVPTPLVEPLLELDWSSNHTLKTMFTGGERLAISKGYNIPFRLIDLYGPTENTVVTTSKEVDVTEKRSESSSIGKPIANVRTYILDKNLKPVPIGVVGELCISGSSLAVGYKGRPELTAEKFVANPFSEQNGDRLYKTGDMARYLPDGSIDFIGRKDNQVKIRGYRIELGEIEYALKQHSNVKAALLLKSEDEDPKLIAYVIVNDKNNFFESGLKEYLQLKLPSFMIPFRIFALEKFPINTNGKIDRNTLLNKLFHNSLVESTKIELNTNIKTKSILSQKPIEEEMIGIWKKEIGLDSVQLDDHFFKVGGHSLLLTKIMGVIQDRFNVQVSLRALFETPTVKGMADQVREALNQKIPLTIEEEMIDIWKKEIGLDSVQLDDHFFKVGGHSLLLTKIMGAIQDRFNVQVSLRALFETPTVKGMADQVREALNQKIPLTIEEEMIDIWKKEIGLDSVQLDDHFFKVGGHSLLLTKIMGAIQDRFNVQVSLRALFETPTVKGMADQVREALNQKIPLTIEEEMIDIWKKEIGLDSVQLDDHFFKVGGHSLLLTKIMGAIQDRFNVQVSLRALFETPTVKEMADQVREALNQKIPLTIEEEMIDIWKKEIGLDSVQLDDHFFKVGGHSLLLTKIMGAIQDRFNVQVSLRALFETPTVRGMADQVRESRNDSLDEIGPKTINRYQIPLSYNQQRLWFMDRLTTEKAAYNVPILLDLHGKLDVQALNHSINKVIERHEILRTYFKDGEKVVQVVEEELRIETPVVNLMVLSGEERQHRIMTMKREEVHKPFNLEVGPLIRSLIIQETPNKYLFILNIHHILVDGWSIKILIEEIASFYISYVNKTEPNLPALPIQYGDYAAWQRDWLEGHYLDKQLNYWKEKLNHSMSTLSLRTDYLRPKKLKHIGGKESIELSSEIVEAVRNLSHDKNVTSYMTFMAAFKVLLYCYTKQEDLSIGTLIGNRTKSELEHLIGFFVNTLVIRTKISESQKFEDLLDDVRTTVLEAYANQEVPFEKIVEEVQPKRTLGYSPLFQVLYTYESNLKSNLKFGDVSVNPHPFDSDYTKFDLTLAVEDLKDKVKITMEYNSSLFNKETIIRMLDDLRIIIKEIVAASKVSLKRLSTILDIESKYQETYPNKGENKQMISTKKQFKDPNMNEEKDLIPSNMLEVKMKTIWQEILEVEEVKGTDNFFELGGHSLNALQMISKLKKMYKVNIPVSYIFDNPSLTQFSSAVLLAILSDIECSTGEEL
ncbi:amino acid adenylation domain-containing protein (plasmid) [Bacillus mycoides]|uniref:amino acid adenylation domain-containing protein n=1 Tax=Bacillus mycoides TaxID=1405 RepID=UPI003F74CF99